MMNLSKILGKKPKMNIGMPKMNMMPKIGMPKIGMPKMAISLRGGRMNMPSLMKGKTKND